MSGKATDRGRHDYTSVGFKCGLEIHQQLATGKLFCRCASDVIDVDTVEERTVFRLERRLRPTESELGQMDAAAAAEARRGKTFRYQGIEGHSCLVDADEEPPHDPDPDAIDVTLKVAALMDSKPVDEIEFMRKIVIDGSNTSGFQRTGLVALGGSVADVSIWTIATEEDSCRKLDTDEEGLVHYTLDRLGIPLIEIATGPEVRDARHAQEVAARIGALLRATGQVRRGLGTIRQDLNVSIAEGDRVEIKGVQDLRAIPRVIDNEIDRQLHLVQIRDTLGSRGIDEARLGDEPIHDVSAVFAKTAAKVVQGALKQKGGVYALRLPGFAGLIKGATKDGPRLGREFAGYAKREAGVRGVFHSDELPAYGITDAEVEAIGTALGLGPDDGYVLAAEREPIARAALAAVRQRAIVATQCVPREVRNALPDESTTFLRPLPGAARMYPETDIAPVAVTAAHWAHIQASLPELPEDTVARLAKQHGLSVEITKQLVGEDQHRLFEEVVAAVARPSELSRLMLQTLPELGNDGIGVSWLAASASALTALLRALGEGRFAKEALPDVAKALCEAPDAGIDAAIEAAGATAFDSSEVEAIVVRIVEESTEMVKAQGPRAMGPLMGMVMAELRGKADGQLVSKLLKAEIDKVA